MSQNLPIAVKTFDNVDNKYIYYYFESVNVDIMIKCERFQGD